MKVCNRFDHNGGLAILETKSDSFREILSALEHSSLDFKKNRPPAIRRELAVRLGALGWADRVHVGRSNLTISFLKDRIGVCLQLGNVSRTYADILKLLYLKSKSKIDCAIVIVPDSHTSRELGANYAGYERLVREFQLFEDIIDCPTLLIALSS